MIKRPSNYTPPLVSRYYILDWEYAVDIFNATVLRFVSLLVLILPIIIDTAKVAVLSIPPGLLYSSVLFIAALLIFYFFCPRLVREYRDFGQYRARSHSHRWIVWLFHNNIKPGPAWAGPVKETVAKGLSVEINCIKNGEIRAEVERGFTGGEAKDTITVYTPVNINRDVYLPIQVEDKKFVLYLEEDDTKLGEKEKELFWILYTQAVKEHIVWRTIFWILITVTIILFVTSMFMAISSIALTSGNSFTLRSFCA